MASTREVHAADLIHTGFHRELRKVNAVFYGLRKVVSIRWSEVGLSKEDFVVFLEREQNSTYS